MSDDIEANQNFIPTGDATAILPARNSSMKPITVIGTEKIRNGFDAGCIEQALNSRGAPGVTELVLNPDAHMGYGAPVGVRSTIALMSARRTGRSMICSTAKSICNKLIEHLISTPTGPG